MPFSSYPAVEEIRERGIGEQGEGVKVLIMNDEVPNCWSRQKPGEGQEIRYIVDVLVSSGVKFELCLQSCSNLSGR